MVIDHLDGFRLELPALRRAVERRAKDGGFVGVDVLGNLGEVGRGESGFDGGLNKGNSRVAAEEDERVDIVLQRKDTMRREDFKILAQQ